MSKNTKLVLPIAAAILVLYLLFHFVHISHPAILTPKGEIASKERNLIITTTLLMLIVVVPVYLLTFFIIWRYREGNTKAKYTPDWDKNRILETIWWGLPIAIISILAFITWRSSHQLDPFKPLASTTKPLTVDVVALQWKWLFIYPEQDIASVNFLQIPKATPVNFYITSDAPMNSFWIPQLGGQIYAMPGMKTQLHLIANESGDYQGSSANLSGNGFASMRFLTRASDKTGFDNWVESVKQSPGRLDARSYAELSKTTTDGSRRTYSSTDPYLFDQTVYKYMSPGPMDGMSMPMNDMSPAVQAAERI